MKTTNPEHTPGQPKGWLHRFACKFLGCPVPAANSKLGQQARDLLERKEYVNELPVLNELIDSFNYSERNIRIKIVLYKCVGYFLLFAIPIISTLIAFMANASEDATLDPSVSWLQGKVPLMSLILAVLTVVNSIIKPGIRFDRCCRIGVDLFHWRCSFLEGLEKIESSKEKELLEFLSNKRKEFRKLQLADISLALPDQT